MKKLTIFLREFPYEKRLRAELAILLIVVIGVLAYAGNERFEKLSLRIDEMSAKIALIESNIASTAKYLEQNITDAKTSLSSELQAERQNVSRIQGQLGSFEQEVGEISGTVTTLEKLSKTDPELLQKYSKVFFLNEHYTPPRLVEIPENNIYQSNKNFQIHASAWPYLENLLGQADSDGIDLFVFSAYRSFDTQEALKGQYTVVYGAGTANQFSADQGYSEHQLGTTLDFITLGIEGTLSGFENTSAYSWLLSNAHRFGFVLSYPPDNEFYVFEPWHWRFVGVELATDLFETRKNFYDLDQREIDVYLVKIFE